MTIVFIVFITVPFIIVIAIVVSPVFVAGGVVVIGAVNCVGWCVSSEVAMDVISPARFGSTRPTPGVEL